MTQTDDKPELEPLGLRVITAAAILGAMPLWYPLIVGFFALTFAAMVVFISVILALMPLYVLLGVHLGPPRGSKRRFEVEVDRDQVGAFLAEAEAHNARVTER